MTNELTGQTYIDIIDEIFNYPSSYWGFSLTTKSGVVKHLAWLFKVEATDVLTVLSQMMADEQLVEAGFVYPDMTYMPNPTMIKW